jgi:hypothetical protein
MDYMKTELEPQDVQVMVEKVVEQLKPYLSQRADRQEDTIFDVPGLCEYLHVSKSWVYERTHLKEIPFIKLPGQPAKGLHGRTSNKILFKKSAIDTWLERNKVPEVSHIKHNLNLVKK